MRVICVACPTGCAVEVEVQGGAPVRVSGHGCPRGEAYAREETLEPKRMLTTSVRVLDGALPLASVRTVSPIPLRLFPQAMRAIRSIEVRAPVAIGQTVVSDLLDTGSALVVTRAVVRKEPS